MQPNKKKTRVWIWIVVAVVVTVAVGLTLLNSAVKRAAQPVYASHTVETGTVERTITGSGRLTTADSETLRLPGGVHVASVPAKAGDVVQTGDALATLDVASLKNIAAQTSSDLSSLDSSIAKRSKVSSVKAPVRGRIKFLPAQIGDDVLSVIDEYGALALISSDDRMQVEITTAAQLELYSTVSVRWDGGSAEGTVFQKTDTGYLITLTDNGTPYQASAQVYNGDTLLGGGTLLIHAPVAVLAAGGEITDIEVKENTLVYARSKLFSLEDAPDSASYRTSYQERADKAALYQTLLQYIADPRVLAPVDGFIDEVLIEEDTDIAASTATDGLSDAFTIHAGGAVKLTVDVDELDIDAVALGQSASVTLDAYPGETFEATVTHISRIGTLDGTITTYPVEVTLNYDERLLEGMDGSAVILTSKKENVTILPLDLISEDSSGVYVYVQDASGKGYTRKDITTGLSDGMNAEVTSGLAAGDVIWYLDKSGNTQLGAMMERRNAYAEENGYPTIGGN